MHMQKYEIDQILKPLVKDLTILENTGVTAPLTEHSVHGTLSEITDYNLAMHSICGFSVI